MKQKTAGIEKASNGVGISTSARVYARRFYASQGNTVWAMSRNEQINNLLAQDFASSENLHKFKLKSNEIAVIRKSSIFTYVAVMRNGNYDIIVLQDRYKESRNPEISKRRLQDKDWGK